MDKFNNVEDVHFDTHPLLLKVTELFSLCSESLRKDDPELFYLCLCVLRELDAQLWFNVWRSKK